MEGERPVRLLLSMLGMDQHEAGAFAVAALLRDAGMEVVYGGRFGVPETILRTALEEGVDVIGLSCHSWEYLYYLDELMAKLKSEEIDIPVVLGGSVLSQSDRDEVRSKGVAETFGPGSTSEEIVTRIQDLVARRREAC